MGAEKLVRERLESCPHCTETPHDFAIVMRDKPRVFGGRADEVAVALTCPTTGRPIQHTIVLPNDQEFVRVAGDGEAPATTGDDDGEYADWVKSSREIGLGYGKTMLSTSTGAVAVYFAVLKFLGTTELSKTFSGVLAALPPILFLLAAVAFAVALRPKLRRVGGQDFAAFRDGRLQEIDRALTVGGLLFGAAMLLTLLVYADALDLL